MFNLSSSQVAISLKLFFISTFCSSLFGFSGTSKYNFSFEFKFKSNKLLALSVTCDCTSFILSKTRHFPSLTPFNKNPYFHSIEVSPDSSFDNICFPIMSEQEVSEVHIMKSISVFVRFSLTYFLL